MIKNIPNLTQEEKDLFWSKVSIGSSNECWEWKATLNTWGYGRVKIRGEQWGAHRVAYALSYKDKNASELLVCHKCDNRKCCNPAHLFLGTIKDNSQDASRKGRLKFKNAGESHGMSKFTNQDIADIRRLYDLGYSQREIASKYNANQSAISRIITKKRWSHIP